VQSKHRTRPPELEVFLLSKQNMKEIEGILQRNISFCQAPSDAYLKMLEKCDGDPRSVAGQRAINQAGSNAERGWFPTWDARNAK
jgi:hypothetical protein